jgi:4-hydroxy-3-methylbut-2-enyl diphosphate reductase
VDGVLIIGGKNSANTQRLLTSALRYFDKAALIETADEIPPEFFQLQRVGLSAGASTPDEVIDAVERRLQDEGNVLREEL